jgi:hypothetical protein
VYAEKVRKGPELTVFRLGIDVYRLWHFVAGEQRIQHDTDTHTLQSGLPMVVFGCWGSIALPSSRLGSRTDLSRLFLYSLVSIMILLVVAFSLKK